MTSRTDASAPDTTYSDVLRQYWGFENLRPLQAEAIEAGIAKRDSLVVMPTGAGKSLCYQVPPLVADRTDIVISPLISLMKDQVDGLRACGYPAAALHSNLDYGEREQVMDALRQGALRLLFVSPERLVASGFMALLTNLDIQAFAIDEAHCISHWGHDFRPEYRQLATLKERFPGVSVHAFTATATPRVQRDILEQLRLDDPNVLVGAADRPNLTYRIVPRLDRRAQVLEVVRRHAGEAVIVYCISRRDTEEIAAFLEANRVKAGCYHAGLPREKRSRTQEAFTREKLDVVVATVAFGMGIDRSDVRAVVHAAMPKTIEHYQQETGRAGRDGLEAECVLLYTAADPLRWKGLIERSAAEGDADDESLGAQLELLRHMQGLCSTLECRHKALSRYFGQPYERATCGACDVCLGEVDAMTDSTVVAQKILSCIARVDQRYGVGHVVNVLRGAATDSIKRARHDQLSTYGLLSGVPEKALTNLVYQLVDQDLVERTGGDRPVLVLTDHSRDVLRGERDVRLVEPKLKRSVTRTSTESWEGVDRDLFEHLREIRRTMAAELGVPPYVVFSDATLRDLARMRPSRVETMRSVYGVGERKLVDFGGTFLEAVQEYCAEHDLETDVNTIAMPAPPIRPKSRSTRPNPLKEKAMSMFAEGASLDEVVTATGRTPGTVAGYLGELIEETRPDDIDTWVPRPTYDEVATVVDRVGDAFLGPVFEALEGRVPYDAIRLVIVHRKTRRQRAQPQYE